MESAGTDLKSLIQAVVDTAPDKYRDVATAIQEEKDLQVRRNRVGALHSDVFMESGSFRKAVDALRFFLNSDSVLPSK